MGDLSIDGKVILKYILKKYFRVCASLDWNHLTHNRLLCTLWWVSVFQKWRRNSWQDKRLLDSREGLCCMESVSDTLHSASSYGPKGFHTDERSARREIALFRCSNRVEVDWDNLNAILLLLLCTRTVLALVRQRVGSLIFLSMIVLKCDGRGQRVNKKNGSGF
jgi:hypothetical protein